MLNGSTDNVRQKLFQKRNGNFYLMVWMEVSSWDFNTQIDLYPPPQQVILTLQDSNRISSVVLYALNNSGDVNTFNLTINNNQVTFNVTDKISIIKLSNNSASILHGLYRLTPKSALHSCLESTGDQNDAVVIQSHCRNSFNQQWIVKPMGNDFYRLINRANGRVLGVDDCNSNNVGVVQLYDWLGSACQKWKFKLLPICQLTSPSSKDETGLGSCSRLNDRAREQPSPGMTEPGKIEPEIPGLFSGSVHA